MSVSYASHTHSHTHSLSLSLSLSLTHTHTHTHTHTRMHADFGNRPRRLYCVVNPTSGNGGTEKLWSKIQQMFSVGQIVTDVISELLHEYCVWCVDFGF